jgi:hypothetical protein
MMWKAYDMSFLGMLERSGSRYDEHHHGALLVPDAIYDRFSLRRLIVSSLRRDAGRRWTGPLWCAQHMRLAAAGLVKSSHEESHPAVEFVISDGAME